MKFEGERRRTIGGCFDLPVCKTRWWTVAVKKVGRVGHFKRIVDYDSVWDGTGKIYTVTAILERP